MYLKDEVVGDLLFNSDVDVVDEIACLDPPAARLASGILGGGRFGVVELSSEQPRIRKEFIGAFGRFGT